VPAKTGGVEIPEVTDPGAAPRDPVTKVPSPFPEVDEKKHKAKK